MRDEKQKPQKEYSQKQRRSTRYPANLIGAVQPLQPSAPSAIIADESIKISFRNDFVIMRNRDCGF